MMHHKRILIVGIVLALIGLASPLDAAVTLSPDDIQWSSLPGDVVQFQLRFRNPTPLPSEPVEGMVYSQLFGAFLPDAGTIGPFNLPPIMPESFFDVFLEIPRSQLPPSAEERLPLAARGQRVEPETFPCPPDDHWDGNVDVVWSGIGGSGQVNKHFGTILVGRGAGNSYIHLISGCMIPPGASWSIKNVCPGFSVALLNEDYSPAPNPLPPGWTGWIATQAGLVVPGGTVCTFQVNLVCGTQTGVIDVQAIACNLGPKAPQPVLGLIEWTTLPGAMVQFHLRWDNPDPTLASDVVNGEMFSQLFGAFLPNYGPIGSFTVPPIQPESFFDVFTEVALSQLPPSAEEHLPGGFAVAATATPETDPPCPPDDHWDGNVDVVWTSPKLAGEVHKHFGTLQVGPGMGNSLIHVITGCADAAGVSWTIKGVCAGFTAVLLNEDMSPAPNPVPAGWTGWLAVSADASVPVGTRCCLQLNLVCAGGPAVIDLCVTVCRLGVKPPQPVPGLIEWNTLPDLQTVRFHVRWDNPDPATPSDPVDGMMFSQSFGAFLPNFGDIGAFNVPPIAPSSFFDVFVDVPLSQLPPLPEERRPSGLVVTAGGLAPETNPTCPPDHHWDGNIDIVWTGPKVAGEVHYHNGTLWVCPGMGPSYIHFITACADPLGASWLVKGLSPGFTATLVNEDFTPAPNPLPAGWTGWIMVTADPTVAFGTQCCFKINLTCAGVLVEVDVCATTCDCSPKPVQPVPTTIEWTTLPDQTTVRFHVRWTNPDPQRVSAEIGGMMFSQDFGVFAENFGTIGPFIVPPIEPESFFDVFLEVPMSVLPPSAEESHIVPVLSTHSGGPPDYHWDGNVDVIWTGPKLAGEVHKHYGTLLTCIHYGGSLIHVRQMGCAVPPGATWAIAGLCPGFTATLVNEDFSPAPNPVPPGWTGWILVTASPPVLPGTTCCIQVNFLCAGQPATIDLCVTTWDCASKIDAPDAAGAAFAIRSVAPNPTTGTTLVSYAVPSAGRTRLEIYDVTGRCVRTLFDGTATPGIGFATWDGRGEEGRMLNPGTYFIRLIWIDRATTREVQLVR